MKSYCAMLYIISSGILIKFQILWDSFFLSINMRTRFLVWYGSFLNNYLMIKLLLRELLRTNPLDRCVFSQYICLLHIFLYYICDSTMLFFLLEIKVEPLLQLEVVLRTRTPYLYIIVIILIRTLYTIILY